ncbi:MAG: deoxyribose-phosphate aldolase [Bacteroidales bacterium]|nr:deoxyribose-phosphate aldolase [Bacteroidales bacterium]
MISFTEYSFSQEEIQSRAASIMAEPVTIFTEQELLRFLVSIIDLTTLNGNDTADSVEKICQRALAVKNDALSIPSVAAVCIYPTYVHQAKKWLAGSEIKLASVAGAFPSGQSPLHIKVAEVAWTVDQGANEIDMVISRGKLIEGNDEEVFDEIKAIREACESAHMKAILETGELNDSALIRYASELAILAGADFIKTSTGKSNPAATPEAMLIMCETIREYFDKTGIRIGIKPAGGIATIQEAVKYVRIVEEVLGKEWLNPELFRIGASRLLDEVLSKIK